MKLLVLAMDYPAPDGKVALMYVHQRNKYYAQAGMDVTVLNFSAKSCYELDAIHVIDLQTYEQQAARHQYDLLVSHASNLKNHYRFLKKYESFFQKIVFFFHGHEVLRITQAYPPPFPFASDSTVWRRFLQNRYDTLKLYLWRRYYEYLAPKSYFVFVSNWLYNEFLQNTKIDRSSIEPHVHIINNSVGNVFEQNSYHPDVPKDYDFITIRSIMDDSKYGVDIVNDLARHNPELKFLIVGKGSFFTHYPKADNVEWMNKTLFHQEMLSLLDRSRCGLLPTREDTQGVMTCEMAAYGLPVITSDIPVCHEIFDPLENVVLIDNQNTSLDLSPLLQELTGKVPFEKDPRYFYRNTTQKEIALLKQLANEK